MLSGVQSAQQPIRERNVNSVEKISGAEFTLSLQDNSDSKKEYYFVLLLTMPLIFF